MSQSRKIVLIEDDGDHLAKLTSAVKELAEPLGFTVAPWQPSPGESAEQSFVKQIEDGATLVVTDYDLTKGPPGFFGVSVVAWCQRRAIPVGDYSRGSQDSLPKDPNIFEFRVPIRVSEAAEFITAVASGFGDIDTLLSEDPDLIGSPSPADMLARLLKRPEVAERLSLYEVQIGANTALLSLLQSRADGDRRRRVATYVLGHTLFNLVLRYPGPLLDRHAVSAYFASSSQNAEAIGSLLKTAIYDGPFCELGPFYWRDDIDELVAKWATEEPAVEVIAELAVYRRALAEEKLKQALTRYDCPRCLGELGGFLCPFTAAVVCEREDCSVATSSWVPQGADLSRVERSFYDETSPMLGL